MRGSMPFENKQHTFTNHRCGRVCDQPAIAD